MTCEAVRSNVRMQTDRRLLLLKYDWCYNEQLSLILFDIKYNHLKRFLICGPASCPHLLPLNIPGWVSHGGNVSRYSPVFWCLMALGLIFRLEQPSQCPPLPSAPPRLRSRSTVYTLCYTRHSRSVTEHSVARILWHRQQPTASWRNSTARSSNKTPRLQRRGQFIENNI